MNDFFNYIINNGRTENTARCYVTSLRTTIDQFYELGWFSKPFSELTSSEIAEKIPAIMESQAFQELNEAGHNQRSNALNWYLEFLNNRQ